MNKIVIGIVLGLILVGCSFLVGGYYNLGCEPIDYENEALWNHYESQGLFPIIDIKTNQPIKYPIGCES